MLGLGSSLVYDGFLPGEEFRNDQALNFDGVNDFAKWPSESTFEDLVGNSPFTISAWCQYNVPSSAQGSTGNTLLGDNIEFVGGVISALNLGTIFGPGHATASSRNTMNFSLIVGSTIYFQTIVQNIDNYITNGQYFHLAYTSQVSGGIRLGRVYINGVGVSSTDFSNSGNFSGIGITGQRFGVKNQLGSVVHYTRGKLDEFSIYNIVLSAGRIVELYNSGCPIDNQASPSLIGYWRMEEPSGNALDTSSNSNDIVRYGATFTTNTPC